jgi:hypothetical protein
MRRFPGRRGTADPAAINLEIAFDKAIRDAIIDVLERHGGELPEKKVCKLLGITSSDIPRGNDVGWEKSKLLPWQTDGVLFTK